MRDLKKQPKKTFTTFHKAKLSDPLLGELNGESATYRIYKLQEQGLLASHSDIIRTFKEDFPSGFEREILVDTYYTLRYAFNTGVLAWLLYKARTFLTLSPMQNFIAILAYGIAQGIVQSGGMWLCHDYSHATIRRKRDWKWLLDIYGLFHAVVLMVPYHQWRFGHCKIHHAHTNHSEKDEAYFPILAPGGASVIAYFFRLVMVPTLFRFYMFFSFDGGNEHFIHYSWPKSSSNNDVTKDCYASRNWCFWGKISILGCLFTLGLNFLSIYHFGFIPVFIYYIFPLIMHDLMFVVLTFNHHTHDETLWMNEEKWGYVAGVLSSVDRTYGSVIDNLFHHINLHVCHHLCQDIPHYKTAHMTEILQLNYPELYIWAQDENGFLSFAKTWCRFALSGYIDKMPNYWGYSVGSLDKLE